MNHDMEHHANVASKGEEKKEEIRIKNMNVVGFCEVRLQSIGGTRDQEYRIFHSGLI